jgi:hypothetical protein
MSVGFGFSLPALAQYGGGGNNPFGQLGPTLDLSFAGTVTDTDDPNGYTLNTDFIVPQYQIAAQYTIWETNVGLVSRTFSQIITFTRASTATYFDSAGVLQSAAIDAPRFDYDPSTLAAQGLLIEEQRTNLLLQSGWAGAVGGSPGTAPTSWTIGFGTGANTTLVNSIYGTAEQAIKFDADATERIMYQQAISVTNGVQYAASVYIEAVSGVIGDAIAVTNGTGTATQNTFVTNPSTPGRYTILFTATATGTVNIRYGIGTTATVAGTCSVTMSRPQVEAGAFPTSYIPTTTTALTRSADVASVNTLAPWFNSAASTLYAEWTNIAAAIPTGGTQIVTEITDVTANNFYRIFQSQGAGTKASTNMFSGGVNPGRLDSGGAYSTATVKAASAFAASDRAISANGTAATTSATGSLPVGVTALNLGQAGSTSNLNGWLRRVSYFPRRLANAELVTLTA